MQGKTCPTGSVGTESKELPVNILTPLDFLRIRQEDPLSPEEFILFVPSAPHNLIADLITPDRA